MNASDIESIAASMGKTLPPELKERLLRDHEYMFTGLRFEKLIASILTIAQKPPINEADALFQARFLAGLSDVKPFIFEPTVEEGEEPQMYPCPEELDLPFPMCAFEVRGRTIGYDPISQQECVAVIVREEAPREYIYWTLRYDIKRRIFFTETFDGRPGVYADVYKVTTIRGMVNRLIVQLKHSDIGTEPALVRFKLKDGSGSKHLIKIKDIVRVAPKNAKMQVSPIFSGRTIDWSHRWEVRGHWRKIDGIGKDRGGSYRTEGYTWVVPHLKGPETSPLVVKTRLVTDPTPKPAPHKDHTQK